MASVANAYVRDARAHFKHIRDASSAEFETKVTCCLTGREKFWASPPNDVVNFLFGKCACCCMDDIENGIILYHKANICRVEFAAGQSIAGNKHRSCGSVITSVIDGQSRYGLVTHFFTHFCIHNVGMYARVRWMNKTDYPFEGTPLVVRIKDDAPQLPQSIISIFDIDPSRIIVERSDTENCYYMCRIEGYDTIDN